MPRSKPQIEYIVRVRCKMADGHKIAMEADRYDSFQEALEHRDWLIGHVPWAVECWVEKLATYNVGRVGAVAKQKRPRA